MDLAIRKGLILMKRRSLMITGMMAALAGLVLAVIQTTHADNRKLGQSPSWKYLNDSQGWDKPSRDAFYYTSQGSEMMPYKWFLSIEVKESQDLFCTNLERFGFIIPPPNPLNPDLLPLGFVK